MEGNKKCVARIVIIFLIQIRSNPIWSSFFETTYDQKPMSGIAHVIKSSPLCYSGLGGLYSTGCQILGKAFHISMIIEDLQCIDGFLGISLD